MFDRALLFIPIVAISLCLLVGCKRESPPMAIDLKSWERVRFEPGGGNAMVLYVVYGAFTNNPSISRAEYRTAGVPPGVEMRKLSRKERPALPFTDGDFAGVLRNEKPSLFASIEHAPGCLIFQGEVVDPSNLDYLRDCVGLVTYFMEHGGVAVTDAQQLKCYGPVEWRREFFEPEKPDVHHHVSILFSAEPSGGSRWFHTRGLRKFGRPDLSLRHVPDVHEKAAIELCNRFIELQALGGRIPEGQVVRMASLPDGLVCRHKGSLDDPDFNNVHVEIEFPVER